VTVRHPVRTLLGGLVALACALTVLSLSGTTPSLGTPELEPAADLSQFKAGNIISDAVFYDSGAMTATQVKSFLTLKGSNCRQSSSGPACIKDLIVTTTSRAGDAYCSRYEGARESAAAMIKKVGVACGINPRVLLVMLQKEQGIITQSTATAHEYSRAMGFGCPDSANGGCDSLYYGLFNQVYNAARQFKVYAGNPGRYGHRAGLTNSVRYSPDKACGSSAVLIENQATASLYNYTPYQPTKAALAAGYGAAAPTVINGVKHYCGAYGNRNFYNWFTDWFGSTQVGGRDVDAPVGRLEAVADKGGSVLVRGWAFDPNSPTSPVQLNVFAGGTMIGTDVTDLPRPDVAASNSGVGGQQGFEARLAVAPGKQTICVYPVNIGAGTSNPRLGCATLTITTQTSWNPKGTVTDVRVAGTRLVVEGWSFDPDAPKWPSTIRFYAGSLRVGDIVADDRLSSVARAYPEAGSAHGFTLSTRLAKGKHRVCAYSINKGSGTTSTRLGCRTVTVTAPPLTPAITTGGPVGRLATLDQGGGTGQDVAITGWSFDPDAATAPAAVRIVAGARVLDTVFATSDWADVQKYFPYAGSAHGFRWSGILPHGAYDLCLQGVDQGAGSDTTLGCKAVTVVGDPAANPKGRLASAVASGTDVTVKGWSYDPDALGYALTVRLYDGSTVLGDVVASEQYPDLAQFHPAAGTAHGFSWQGTVPVGHEICAYAINVTYGTTNPGLGCLTPVSSLSTGETEAVPSPTEVPTETTEPTETTGATQTTPAETSASDTGSADAQVPAEPTLTPTETP
jgi:hypothetical protein